MVLLSSTYHLSSSYFVLSRPYGPGNPTVTDVDSVVTDFPYRPNIKTYRHSEKIQSIKYQTNPALNKQTQFDRLRTLQGFRIFSLDGSQAKYFNTLIYTRNLKFNVPPNHFQMMGIKMYLLLEKYVINLDKKCIKTLILLFQYC